MTEAYFSGLEQNPKTSYCSSVSRNPTASSWLDDCVRKRGRNAELSAGVGYFSTLSPKEVGSRGRFEPVQTQWAVGSDRHRTKAVASPIRLTQYISLFLSLAFCHHWLSAVTFMAHILLFYTLALTLRAKRRFTVSSCTNDIFISYLLTTFHRGCGGKIRDAKISSFLTKTWNHFQVRGESSMRLFYFPFF